MTLFPPGEAELLLEVHDLAGLLALPRFAAHDAETCAALIAQAQRTAEDVLLPAYAPMDREPPRFEAGRVRVHPAMRELYPRLVELGALTANRSEEVGGLALPMTVCVLVHGALMAGNLGAYGYAGLTSSAAHLIERFGDAATREAFMRPMYDGRWTGTMALTEPQAGSSLGDVATRATPSEADGPGRYRIRGAKVFISGGDQDFTENIVHLALARIDGAPAGVRGLSLFAVPRLRPDADDGGALVDNDVACTGAFHKMGWRGIPSVALSFGDRGDCHGWLVGEAGQGLANMFRMMNEARIMVGLNGVATAMVAQRAAIAYARERPQGRPAGAKDPRAPQVPIVEHADVRRMLLRGKAITEGLLSLLVATARYADLAEAAPDAAARARAHAVLEVLTPIAKTAPAELGFEVNALAVQVHGGYGYTSEYLPESWLRDQKLNSLHEGTTGIQAIDLVGRKLGQHGAAGSRALLEDVAADVTRARTAGVDGAICDAMAAATALLARATGELLARGAAGQVERMLARATEVMAVFGVALVGWQWVRQLAHLASGGGGLAEARARGKRAAAAYWFETEMPLLAARVAVALGPSASFVALAPDEL